MDPLTGAPRDHPALAPSIEREYQHLLRGPCYAWWRPLLAMALVVGLFLIALVLLALTFYVIGLGDALDEALTLEEVTPTAFAILNLWLASLIPTCILATRLAHRVGRHCLSSVAGGIRWGWLLRCLGITAPLFAVYIALELLLGWSYGPRPEQWLLLLGMVAIGTPFQAAGEEYLFRGLVLQNVGAWFAHPQVAWLVGALVSTVTFTAAHGSADIWIVSDLAIGALASAFLVWRTGGLEAAIALHATNNVALMFSSLLLGGWQEGFVSPASQGHPLDAVMTLAVCSAVVPLVLRLARRHGIQRVHRSPAAAPRVGLDVPPAQAGLS